MSFLGRSVRTSPYILSYRSLQFHDSALNGPIVRFVLVYLILSSTFFSLFSEKNLGSTSNNTGTFTDVVHPIWYFIYISYNFRTKAFCLCQERLFVQSFIILSMFTCFLKSGNKRETYGSSVKPYPYENHVFGHLVYLPILTPLDKWFTEITCKQ